MRLKLALVLALAAAMPLAAHAQTAAASPERLKLARQVFEAQGGLANISAAVGKMIDSVTASMPADTDAAREARAAAKDTMTEMLPQILDIQTEALAETFNEQQLGDILTFYRSPTGQYMSAHLSEITARTGAAMGKLMPAVVVKILDRTCAKTTCTAAQQSQLAALKRQLAASPAP